MILIAIALLDSAEIISQDVTYPYPSDSISILVESQQLTMSYMDIKSDNPNGKAVILFTERILTATTGRMS